MQGTPGLRQQGQSRKGVDRKLCPRLVAPLNIKDPGCQVRTILASDFKAETVPRPQPPTVSAGKAAWEMPDQDAETVGSAPRDDQDLQEMAEQESNIKPPIFWKVHHFLKNIQE